MFGFFADLYLRNTFTMAMNALRNGEKRPREDNTTIGKYFVNSYGV